jgi:hypothetical protein
MPRFTLTKHPDGQYDSEVTVSFECEMVDVARAHFDDFLQGSGFSLPDDAPFETKISFDDYVAKEEDWMWNDAFASKFSSDEVYNFTSTKGLGYDGLVGGTGNDVIILDDHRKESFIPTLND